MAGSIDNILPFRGLTDFEIEEYFLTDKASIVNRMENNGFKQFMDNYSRSNENGILTDCKYYDIDEYNALEYVKNRSSVKVLNLNIRRIAKNKGELIAFLQTLSSKIDILILTETGDDAGHYINENSFPDYYYCIEPSTNNRYGGVAILIRKELGEFKLRNDLSLNKSCACTHCEWETLWLEVNIDRTAHIIGAIYRHPKGDTSHFTEELTKKLDKIPKTSISIIAGDMNIDLIKYEECSVHNYFATLSAYNFSPYITLPTRLTAYSATLIDHMFLRLPAKNNCSQIIAGNFMVNITDHLPSFLILPNNEKDSKEQRPKCRIFSEKNMSKFSYEMKQINWDEILPDSTDPDLMCNQFYNVINRLYEKCFPYVKVSKSKFKDKPWVTLGLKKSIKHKNLLYRKNVRSPSEHNFKKYNDYKNLLSTCIKDAEINHFKNIFENKKESSTNFWKSLGKSLQNRKSNNKNTLNKIILNNKTLDTDEDIANGMNSFFCSIGENISKTVRSNTGSINDFRRYLKDKVEQSFFSPSCN